MSAEQAKPDLSEELQKIYDSEINVRISWLWDGGIDVRLGDELNGYEAEENFSSVAEILPWLQAAIAHFYPNNSYASGLGPEIQKQAERTLFRPPAIGAIIRCPHCDAPHASPGGMDLLAFVCWHCGQGVKVPEAKIH